MEELHAQTVPDVRDTVRALGDHLHVWDRRRRPRL
jgi:hypothetical protein